MSLSYYVDTAFLKVGIWAYKDNPYAESTDSPNSSSWGLNHNWRAIADALVHLEAYKSETTHTHADKFNISGSTDIWKFFQEGNDIILKVTKDAGVTWSPRQTWLYDADPEE